MRPAPEGTPPLYCGASDSEGDSDAAAETQNEDWLHDQLVGTFDSFNTTQECDQTAVCDCAKCHYKPLEQSTMNLLNRLDKKVQVYGWDAPPSVLASVQDRKENPRLAEQGGVRIALERLKARQIKAQPEES